MGHVRSLAHSRPVTLTAQLNTIAEYEEERAALITNLTLPVDQLTRPEYFLYELFTIPRVRETLSAMIFSLEV